MYLHTYHLTQSNLKLVCLQRIKNLDLANNHNRNGNIFSSPFISHLLHLYYTFCVSLGSKNNINYTLRFVTFFKKHYAKGV